MSIGAIGVKERVKLERKLVQASPHDTIELDPKVMREIVNSGLPDLKCLGGLLGLSAMGAPWPDSVWSIVPAQLRRHRFDKMTQDHLEGYVTLNRKHLAQQIARNDLPMKALGVLFIGIAHKGCETNMVLHPWSPRLADLEDFAQIANYDRNELREGVILLEQCGLVSLLNRGDGDVLLSHIYVNRNVAAGG